MEDKPAQVRIKGAGVLPQQAAIVLQLPCLPLPKTGLMERLGQTLTLKFEGGMLFDYHNSGAKRRGK